MSPKSVKTPNAATGTPPVIPGGSWQLQSAKARFSEVFRKARAEGPQRITRQGKEAVVMVAEEQFERLAGKPRRPKSLVDFLRNSPLRGVNLERDPDPGRDIEL